MNRAILGLALAVLSTSSRVDAPQGRTLTIDDFEDGDRRAASGLSWIAIADDLMGGLSHADLQVEAAGSNRALRIAGDVAAEGFAGAWVALDGSARATDVSDFAGIRLRLRGAGTVQVALRGGPQGGFNYAAPVEATPGWKSVDFPFEKLEPIKAGYPAFDRRTVRWLGVSVRRPQAEPFEFEIDDVQIYATRPDAQLRVQDGPTMTLAFEAAPSADVPKGQWKELAADAAGDGKQKRLPDATAVAVSADEAGGLLWFRISLAAPVPDRFFGVNLVLDIDGDPKDGMAWWGMNKAFRFDRLVTVYGSSTGKGYEGMIGIADAAEVETGNLLGSKSERVQVVFDRERPAVVVGIPRSALGTGNASPVRLVAAVGSSFQHNDDVPDEGAALLVR